MVRAACCALALLLSGCAALTQRNYYTDPWCYPKLKWDRHKREAYGGIACRF